MIVARKTVVVLVVAVSVTMFPRSGRTKSNRVRNGLFIRSIAGDVFVVACGVFLYLRRKLTRRSWKGIASARLAFNAFLKVWTNRSASPFVAE